MQQSILKSQRRPITLYFFTIYVTTSFSLWAAYSWWALLYAALVLIVFAFPIALPAFTWIYLRKQNLTPSPKKLLISYGSSFALITLSMTLYSKNIPVGILIGILAYGYPGLLFFVLLRRFKKVPIEQNS